MPATSDERRESLDTNQLVSIVIIILKVSNLIKRSRHIPQNNRKILEYLYNCAKILSELKIYDTFAIFLQLFCEQNTFAKRLKYEMFFEFCSI